MQVLKDNWLIWMPKLFQKVKIESETHKKTYLLFLHIIKEFSGKSSDDICERKPCVFIKHRIMIVAREQ